MGFRIFHQDLTVKTHFARTVAFLCATVALHYLFLETASRRNWHIEKLVQTPLAINLKMDTPEPAVVAPPIETKKTRKSRQAQSLHKNVSANDEKPTDKAPEEEPSAAVIAEEMPKAESTEEPKKSETPFSLRLPPPADMKMEVSYTKLNGSPTNGFGSLTWNTDGSRYSASLEVGVDLLLTTVNLLQINSEGIITGEGLEPRMSTDTRRNRAATAIHFKHDEKNIIFSSSNKTVAMESGAQDALSILMQLAVLGNSDPKRLAPGTSLAIQVAEGRDAQIFHFDVIGEEVIESKLAENGRLHTIHLIRPPRPGSYNSTLEIWLAPEKSWYPVRIKNTESSGTTTLQNVVEIVQRQVLAQ